ncbi:MAG: hypothetical protein UY81_C0034G0008 [Candidatus Giovannonibacteria bacterium GW2011_GWA2_53_7]|uniref:Transglutaminase-like domain-containing protein n=1 Tax=Candidatus Giovannonibacteria bacterium GW2011_GWA2_53_7 TaxID=1618650 RepID=A0A0G1XY12_9BACT|nr:MAG: hypothetical protein UY81_C0034G0008 [Candidatus Giovannonibacteria bacterium GW2011_GWA2_53_7]
MVAKPFGMGISVPLYTPHMSLPYKARIDELLTPSERSVFKKLSSPQKIQDYLDTLPVNFEMTGETYQSPRRVLETGTAHCFEGAVFAAAALAYHGGKPLLLDFQTLPIDDDHVVAPFKQNGHWGAISKTNHAIVRWRDPVYKTIRELAMSYFHEYLLWSGRKSLVAYSAPFDLSTYAPEKWIAAGEDLDDIALALDKSHHFPTVPAKNKKLLRRGSKTEIAAMKIVEWKEPRGYQAGG